MTKKSKTAATGKSPRPIWAKSGMSVEAQADREMCVAYCAGRDVQARPMADEMLIPYDLRVNRAHAAMLCARGIISGAQLAGIERGLARIEKDWKDGTFKLDPALEDVHINIERAVALISGEGPAGVMHTGRSRNDQTATDIRLGVRDELLSMIEGAAEAVRALADFAEAHPGTVMGGWTHGQPAMPTTLGHWACAHGAALARDIRALTDLWPLINQCPLGSAAGFGTSWPIDRKMTADLLGFDAPQSNSLDAVSTRWESEARLGFALAMLMTHLSSLGQDLYFLSSPPARLIGLGDAFTTGSSIMPQKRNPDFAEVTRSRAAAVQSLVASICSVGRAALSGYNRDSQWTKYWIMDLLDEVGAAPQVFARVIATMKPDHEGMRRAAASEFMPAVDLADHLASSRRIEFRRIYHIIGEAVAIDRDKGEFQLETLNQILKREDIHPPLTAAELRETADPVRAVRKRSSHGGPSPKETLRQVRELRKAAGAGREFALGKRGGIERANKKLGDTVRSLMKSKA